MNKWKLELITLYCTVSQAYDNKMTASAQRLSKNSCPQFTDDLHLLYPQHTALAKTARLQAKINMLQ
jgi:hypothetical protein